MTGGDVLEPVQLVEGGAHGRFAFVVASNDPTSASGRPA